MATKSEIFTTITKARQELDTLYDKLERSIRIEEIWPDAFLGGCKCSSILTGTNWPVGSILSPAARKYPIPYHQVRTISRTFLRRSDGVEYDITPEEFFSIFATSIDDSSDGAHLRGSGLYQQQPTLGESDD